MEVQYCQICHEYRRDCGWINDIRGYVCPECKVKASDMYLVGKEINEEQHEEM